MAKKHDESKDVRLVGKIANIDFLRKTISVNKNQPIGIKTWGRIDFLTHCCGYVLVYDGTVRIRSNSNKSYESSDNTKNLTRKKEVKQLLKDKSLKNKKR